MSLENFPRVWLFDINRRVYGKDRGAPIWREHWREAAIVGETRVSWITSHGKKVPKKGGHGIAFSEVDIDRAAFIKDHRWKIGALVDRCDDYDTMRAIAQLVGYTDGDA